MHAHLPSLLSSLRQLCRDLLSALELLESQWSAAPMLPGLDTSTSVRPHAGPLPPPNVPAADGKGGLGYDDILRYAGRSVRFTVPNWDGYQNGDTVHIVYRLRSGIDRILASVPASEADRFQAVDVDVAASNFITFDDGHYDFFARVTNALGLDVDSPLMSVRFKLSIPGGLDPDTGTPWINERLKPAEVVPRIIEPVTVDARVTIVAYDHMGEGDLIQLNWGGGNNDLWHTVKASEVGRPVEIVVPRGVIENGGTGSGIVVRYYIYDVVGNESLWSPAAEGVVVDDPLAPPAPWLDPTVDFADQIFDLEALGTVQAEMGVPSGLAPGDRLVFHVVGYTAESSAVTPWASTEITVRPNGRLPVIEVPNAFFKPLAQGRCEGYYRRTRDGITVESARKRLGVNGKVQRLAPPWVEEAVGDVIDPDRLGADAHVMVEANALIVYGAQVTVEMFGTSSTGDSVSHLVTRDVTSQTTFPMSLPVPAACVRLLSGSRATFTYTVKVTSLVHGRRLRRTVRPHASHLSPEKTYEVRGFAATLPKPIVEQAKDDWLDLADIPDGGEVKVDVRGAELAEGDDVTLTGYGAGSSARFNERVRAHGPTVAFYVPKSFFSSHDGSDVTLEYSVAYKDGRQGRSAALTLHVGSGVGELPAPSVREAAGDTLLPGAIIDGNGVTIQLPASVELRATDQVYASFGSHRTPVAPGQTGMVFYIEAMHLGVFLGTDVLVSYTVTREGAARTSAALRLHVLDFDDQSSLLPRPAITEAEGDLLNLDSFNGDATVTCSPWPLIAQGQRVWLRVHGTKDNGDDDTIVVYDGEAVTADMERDGLSRSVPRERLIALRNESSITLELKVAFRREDDAGATTFKRQRYMLQGALTTPAWNRLDADDFSLFPSAFSSPGRQMARCAFFDGVPSDVKIASSNYGAPYLSGSYVSQVVDNRREATMSMTLRRPTNWIRFGLAWYSSQGIPANPSRVIAIDTQGNTKVIHPSEPGWIELSHKDTGYPIQRVQISSPAVGQYTTMQAVDNLYVDSGDDRPIRAAGFIENFNGVPLGDFSQSTEWRTTTDKCTLSVVTHGTGRALRAVSPAANAFSLNLIPRFSVCPADRMIILASAIGINPYLAVSATYMNRDSLELRTVELPPGPHSSWTFSGKNAATENEYLVGIALSYSSNGSPHQITISSIEFR